MSKVFLSKIFSFKSLLLAGLLALVLCLGSEGEAAAQQAAQTGGSDLDVEGAVHFDLRLVPFRGWPGRRQGAAAHEFRTQR